jgi:hypothetical protein
MVMLKAEVDRRAAEKALRSAQQNVDRAIAVARQLRSR